jgi:hypothetical protein
MVASHLQRAGLKESSESARLGLDKPKGTFTRCEPQKRSLGADIILDGRRDFSPPLGVTLGGQLILLVTRNKR